MENANVLLEKALDFVTYYGPKVLGALLIFFLVSGLSKK